MQRGQCGLVEKLSKAKADSETENSRDFAQLIIKVICLTNGRLT